MVPAPYPFPAPSLRELSSECETEGVSPDEWKTPFVGAMKIARNVAVSERHIEWYAPVPGSLSEGVSSDGSSTPTISYQRI